LSPKIALAPNATPPGGSTDAAGQIEEERVVCIDRDPAFFQLRRQLRCGRAVAEEQMPGLLVVDKIDGRIGVGDVAGVFHGSRVVRFVLYDLDA
jgi:hypothetical protein